MILVTGGSGLLGKALIHLLLSNGKTVKAIERKTPVNINHPNLQIVKGDLLDVVFLETVMQNVEEVYHCAGFVSYVPGNNHLLYKYNVEATANVVNAAIDAGIRKLVHVSSVAALPDAPKDKTVNEGEAWKAPDKPTAYGKSKWLGEMEVWRGIAEGLNAVIVNPSIILGDGNWEDGSSAMFRSVYNGFPWYSEGVTGYVDVRDVADVMVRLMNSDITGERFLVSASNHSYREIFHCMAKGFNTKPAHRKVNATLASLVWRWEKFKSRFSGTPPLVTRETAAQALRITRYDSSKLLNALPEFIYRPIPETIAHFCSVFQQKVNNS